MTAAELVKRIGDAQKTVAFRIDDAQKTVNFSFQFNAYAAAQSVYNDDENREETLAILSSFLKNDESYEGSIPRNVYRWARDYDGITFDRELFEELHHVHPYLFNGFLKAYIKLISSNKRKE